MTPEEMGNRIALMALFLFYTQPTVDVDGNYVTISEYGKQTCLEKKDNRWFYQSTIGKLRSRTYFDTEESRVVKQVLKDMLEAKCDYLERTPYGLHEPGQSS